MIRSLRKRHLTLIALMTVLPALAADGLNVKTGLWETTTVSTMSGVTLPAMPAGALEKMPPAQRAQMEQMMKQFSGKAPTTRTNKECVTEKDLKDGAFRVAQENQDKNCKYTTLTATSKRQEMTFKCSDESAAAGNFVIDANSSTSVHGVMDMKSASMSMNVKIDARWLSASCAGADKDE
jgi:Protein of unknown function (DUF3617)